MSYNLSFSSDFFYAEGEPYDKPPVRNKAGKPYSVYSAAHLLAQKQRRRALAILGIKKARPNIPSTEDLAIALVDRALEVGQVGSLSVPVDVWLDPEGEQTLDVWESDKEISARKKGGEK